MKSLPFSIVIQAFFLFEGLSLWKVNYYGDILPSSLTGLKYKDFIQKGWEDCQKRKNFPVGKICLFLLFMVTRPMAIVTRFSVSVFKICPYIWGLLIPFVILWTAAFKSLAISEDAIRIIATVFFFYMVAKLLFYLLNFLFSLLTNYLYFDNPLPSKSVVSFFAPAQK